MTLQLPDLPYDYAALEPHLSARTLEFHHDKHHRAYVDKYNDAVDGSPLAELTLEEVIQKTADDPAQRGIFNNAAQAWNHTFFWNSMAPDGGGEPDAELLRVVEESFGSLDGFKKAFKETATGQFGSGWAWLVVDNGRLHTVGTPNAEPPMLRGMQPLLTCDVWEHAYYLDYQNDRGGFIDAFLDHLVNWRFAAERFNRQGEGNSVAGRRFQDAQHAFAAEDKEVA